MEERLKKLREEGGVELMKASAGSGKTFSLAREYIRLLLLDRREEHPYRHILAVTFTNKATAEMKSRIIDSLDTLAKYTQYSPYRDYLKRECSIETDEELAKECSRMLTDILCDYGAFSVSTIDHFFQRVLRSFSREVGQFAEYQVELDRDSLVEESVDRVLESLTEGDKDLLAWLSESATERVSEGERYRVREALSDFAGGYMSEKYREKADSLGMDRDKAFSKENLRSLAALCKKICKEYDEGIRKAAAQDLSKAEAQAKPGKYLLDKLAAIFRDGAEGIGDISGRKYWEKASEEGIVSNVEAYLGKPLRIYRTAMILRAQAAVFRVADALDTQFDALLKEKNVLSLDDTNSILRDIIAGSNAPFIYEKVGVRYRHFLLDEFQDTSATQWENFRPLLQNSISEGCYNLIVGDVKQSIYRWRGARWDIFDSRVENELDRAVIHPLEDNWRSAEEIVRFNNSFYEAWAAQLDLSLREILSGSSVGKEAEQRPVGAIYSDVKQNAKFRIDAPGSVEVTFCESVFEQTVEAVEEAQRRGFAQKDIAVLVRTNDMGSQVASHLTARGKHVITNDSLRIGSGITVRNLVSRLYKIDNPSDGIHTYYAADFAPEVLQSCQSLVDICESILSDMPVEQVNADTLYVLAFMDLVRDFASRSGNSLHAFLDYWAEAGAGRSIASPEGTDAITVITIHKAKGLDYPFVIIPVKADDAPISTQARFWEAPSVKGTPFENVENALYMTNLSGKSMDTLFADNYLRELRMSDIDRINTWYVATTRASQAMHIVLEKPRGDGFGAALKAFCDNPASGFANIGDRYLLGTVMEKKEPAGGRFHKPGPDVVEEDLRYYSIDPAAGGARARVRIKTDSSDFFDPEGETTGVSASRRIRGTVLHKILETVVAPEDLHASVTAALGEGLLSQEEAVEAEKMLGDAIAYVGSRGWFPGDASKLLDEREIILPDGSTLRPDRVVLKPDGVDIVDYKFARERGTYIKQVREYAELYRTMGYTNVHAYLWYVDKNEILIAD